MARPPPAGSLRLAGRVVGPGDAPLAGVRVDLVDYTRETVTEADGTFELTGLRAADYRVRVTSEIVFGTTCTAVLTPRSAPLAIRVEPAWTANLRVIDADTGIPIEAACELRGALSDADGVLRVTGLKAGPHHLHMLYVSAIGYARADVDLWSGEDAAWAEGPPPAEQGRVVELRRGAPVGGLTLDLSGAPVEGVWVSVPTPGFGERSDAAGRWQIAGLAAGTYELTASNDQYRHVAPVAVEVDGTTARDDVVIRVDRAPRVAGIVVDADGAPVDGAHVYTRLPDGAAWWSLTDSGGAFETAVHAPGRHGVYAVSGELASEIVEVTVADRERAEVRLVARPSTITGTVLDSSGSAVAGAAVRASTRNGECQRETVSGPDGRFELCGVVPGEYAVTARRPGERRGACPVRGNARDGDRNVVVVVAAET